MYFTVKSLEVKDGIIVLANMPEDYFEDVKPEELTLRVADDYLLLRVKELNIPILPDMYDYLMDNRNITIYPYSMDKYMEKPLYKVEIAQKSLIEAVALFNYINETKALNERGQHEDRPHINADTTHCLGSA